MQEIRESVETTREAPRKKITSEHRMNLSKSMKGRIPWNKGLTKEDPRVRKNTENTQKNPNLRENLSKALMGHKSTFLRKHTLEEIQRISESHRGKKHSYKVWNKGLTKFTDERLAKVGKSISKALMNKTEEWRKETSRRAKLNLIMPKVSRMEKEIQSLLIKEKIAFKSQYKIRVEETITSVDIYLPDRKECIYIDGIYWHNRPEVKERDIKINSSLEQQGYKVTRFIDDTKISASSIVNKILGDDIVRHSK